MHLIDRIKCWIGPRRVFSCEDCGYAPDAPQIHNSIWLSIATKKTLLCTGCTEHRLKRPLRLEDLVNCPMNGALIYYMSRATQQIVVGGTIVLSSIEIRYQGLTNLIEKHMKRLSYKHAAFTGTKQSISCEQHVTLRTVFKRLRDNGYLFLHNGDCIGADYAAAQLWAKRFSGKVILHPPTKKKYRAFFIGAYLSFPKADYLIRDLHMVTLSRRLIACPNTFEEQRRSGTWATIRRARKLRLKITIIFPDGSIREE